MTVSSAVARAQIALQLREQDILRGRDVEAYEWYLEQAQLILKMSLTLFRPLDSPDTAKLREALIRIAELGKDRANADVRFHYDIVINSLMAGSGQ